MEMPNSNLGSVIDQPNRDLRAILQSPKCPKLRDTQPLSHPLQFSIHSDSNIGRYMLWVTHGMSKQIGDEQFVQYARLLWLMDFIISVFFIILRGWNWGHLVLRQLLVYCTSPQMIDDGNCGAISWMKIGRENRSPRRKPAPVPFCPPQIPHDQTRALTRATAVGSQRLTAWALARTNNLDIGPLKKKEVFHSRLTFSQKWKLQVYSCMSSSSQNVILIDYGYIIT
jgi:hypothetical protein